MHVGNGFSFVFLLGKQPHQRPLRLACEAVPTGNEGLRSSSCSINHPIFHEGTKVSASPKSSSLSSFVLTHFLPYSPMTCQISILSLSFPQGIFIVTFDVSYKAALGNKLLLRANASR